MVLETSASGIVAARAERQLDARPRPRAKDEVVTEGDIVITAGWQSGQLESLYPRGIPIGTVSGVGQQRRRPLQAHPGDAARGLRLPRRRDRPDRRRHEEAVNAADILKAAGSSSSQRSSRSRCSGRSRCRRPPRSPARPRRRSRAPARPASGPCAGFWAGLVLDVASFSRRSGSPRSCSRSPATGRDVSATVTSKSSPHPPLIAVGARDRRGRRSAAAFLHFMLGSTVGAAELLRGASSCPTLALNLLLAYPLYGLVRRLFPRHAADRQGGDRRCLVLPLPSSCRPTRASRSPIASRRRWRSGSPSSGSSRSLSSARSSSASGRSR